jgi:hypothetical protein
MAFNPQELEIIKYGVQNGKSRAEVESALSKLRTGVEPKKVQETPDAVDAASLGGRVVSGIKQAGERVESAISGTGEFEGRTPLRRGFEATATAFGAAPAIVAETLPEPVRAGLGKAGEVIGGIVQFLGDKIGSIPAVQNWVSKNPEAAKSLEEVAGIGAASGQIAGTILAAKGAAAGAQKVVDITKVGTAKAVETIGSAIDRARPATKALYNRSKELVKPLPTPAKAVGEVLQGTKPISPRDVKAFRSIDTANVKTYADLKAQVDESIGKLSNQVDDYLSQDPNPVSLNNLVTKTTSGSGRLIERNFVSTAIEHLRELYQKSADDVGLADIDDLLIKAKSTGLTRLEVNDISRLYNSEFGSKAFSKVTGEPLTSVNAQAYENIRTGLKNVARQSMGGTEAAATDKIISSLYNTRDLVTKNVAAVQKLQQRIAERGLFEKIGYTVSKYGDILTGGSIRGFIGGILPRGAGYKLLNALDLEQRLSKNLEIIRKALESGSDDAIINATKNLGVPSVK